jgi:fatty-acyl-CoA synthase
MPFSLTSAASARSTGVNGLEPGKAFQQRLIDQLERSSGRVLLRVALSSTELVELTGDEILLQSRAMAERHASGASAGSAVLLLLPHSVELFLLEIGLVLTGRIPAVLAWPTSRIDAEKYQRNLIHQLQNLPAERVITIPGLASVLVDRLPYATIGCPIRGANRWEQIFEMKSRLDDVPHVERVARPPLDADTLFLQFSGGTTGAQKAVVISSSMLEAQLLRISEALAFGSEDSVVSWLPLYHDMGLIACLWLPLYFNAPSLHFAASDWLLNPGLLFQYIERYGGTFAWLPNFAFSYLASQFTRMQRQYSLDSMRAWINCSEPVRGRATKSFVDCYADWGVTIETIQASYAMAENVFAVTQTVLGEEVPTHNRTAADRAVTPLSFDLLDDVYASSGRPLMGMDVRIVRPQAGDLCSDGHSGEIQLKAESLFKGYWSSDGFMTNVFTQDGWYATGDYGFLADGELYVIGRLKDIIIVGGQNVYPEDVELSAGSDPGVYPGRVVAFGISDEINGTESVVVVAEMRGKYEMVQARALERSIYKAVLTHVGIAPRRVLVVPERWIVKSTAGKISRRETRDRYLSELLPSPEQPIVTQGQCHD